MGARLWEEKGKERMPVMADFRKGRQWLQILGGKALFKGRGIRKVKN